MKLERFVQAVPHASALGLELLRVDMGTGTCAMRQPWREELIGDPERGVVHGGVITTLLDTLGGVCVFARGARVEVAGSPAAAQPPRFVMPQATLDLRIDYLRPASPGLDLFAEGECHRVTRHVAFVRGVCHQGDPQKPIAHMTAAFVIADRPELIAGPKS
jgi:acyl-coenzyme A thioesterase PaaI-like protein